MPDEQRLPSGAIGYTLQVDAQLGLISVDDVEASFVRCLVAFNDKQPPDHCRKLCSRTTRPPRQCASSAPWTAPAATGAPSRVKLHCAGPASAVACLLRGNVGEAHFVVLAHTSDAGEWSVLWHVPVEAHRVEGVKNFMLRIYEPIVKRCQKPTSTHLRPGMDSNEASCKRHGDSAGRRVDD